MYIITKTKYLFYHYNVKKLYISLQNGIHPHIQYKKSLLLDNKDNFPIYNKNKKLHLNFILYVKVLLLHGYDLNLLISNDKYYTLLLYNNVSDYYYSKFLLKHGSNPNIQDNYYHDTPLTYLFAIINDNININKKKIILFLKYGANINHINKDYKSPIYHCIDGHLYNTLEFILQYTNVKPSIFNKLVETEPIYHAFWNNNYKGLRILLKYGVNPNIIDDDGNTLLHFAEKFKIKKYIKLLLEYGANYNIKNKYGNTPLDLALKNY